MHDTEDHTSPPASSNLFVPESENIAISEESIEHVESHELEIPEVNISPPVVSRICPINLKKGVIA